MACNGQPARVAAGLSVIPAVVALLLPKCPACLAAYLAVLGVGTGIAATLAPILRPLGVGLLLVSLGIGIVTRRKLLNR